VRRLGGSNELKGPRRALAIEQPLEPRARGHGAARRAPDSAPHAAASSTAVSTSLASARAPGEGRGEGVPRPRGIDHSCSERRLPAGRLSRPQQQSAARPSSRRRQPHLRRAGPPAIDAPVRPPRARSVSELRSTPVSFRQRPSGGRIEHEGPASLSDRCTCGGNGVVRDLEDRQHHRDVDVDPTSDSATIAPVSSLFTPDATAMRFSPSASTRI
jgi:hypothetical protein